MDKGRKGPSKEAPERPLRRGFRGTAENAKTRICLRWENGECRFGDRCNFAHGKDELRQLEPRLDPGAGRGRGRGRGVIDSAPQDGEDRSIGQGAGRNQPEHPSGGASQSVTPNDTDHSSWVASGCPVQGEHGWTQYQTDSGEKYYHNSDSNVTQWDVPADWTGPV